MTLLNVCDLINNINNQEEEIGEAEAEDLIRRQFPTTLDGFSLEAMLTLFQLQKVCNSRSFQHLEVKSNITEHWPREQRGGRDWMGDQRVCVREGRGHA